MAWWSKGWGDVGTRVAEAFGRATWGEIPPGYELADKRRRMRLVVKGRPEGDEREIHVKWSRPVTRTDRVARALRGPKGPREGAVLRTLEAAGVAVPRVIGWTGEPADLLVTETIPALLPLPTWSGAPPGLDIAVGRCLGRAYGAGLRHRDLHRGNLGLVGSDVWLIDAGRGRIEEGSALVQELARARHGVFGDASWSQRLRALGAFLAAAGVSLDPSALRKLIASVERRARGVRRAYARGRARRATRSGRHYEVFGRREGLRAIRRRETPPACVDRAQAWLEAPPSDAEPLKDDARVVSFTLDGAALVLKRFERVAPGRLPRPLRAFRLAAALQDRGIGVPRAWLAVARASGEGYVVSERAPGQDLYRFSNGGRGGRLAALAPRDRRRLLERLGRFLRHMHDQEVRHRDLKALNIVASLDPLRFWITDLDGVRIVGGPVSLERRARDLARLDANLDATRTDRLRVLDAYARVHPRLGDDRRALLRRIARHVARKRGPSGLPH